MSEQESAEEPDAAGDEETFVGYHGTSSVFVAGLERGIVAVEARNFGGEPQLGTGFYATEDFATAFAFARNAAVLVGGSPAVLEVYARDFATLIGTEVPGEMWWKLPDNSPYLLDFDYLRAPVVGYEPARQIKFNPHTYDVLSVRQGDG